LTVIGSSKTTVYADTTIAPSTTYYYAVLAYDAYGIQSTQSTSLQVATPKQPAPSAPSSLAVQAPAYNSVTLSWTASTSPVGLWGYLVYRGQSPSSLTVIGSSQTAAYIDATAVPSTTYYYAVLACDAYGVQSTQSTPVPVTTPKEPAPSAPSHLAVLAPTHNNVTVSWTASSGPVGLWGYLIYRGKTSSNLTMVGSSKTTAYTDTTAAASTTYYYTVVANDIFGLISAQPVPVSIVTPN
jgi:fibronectin type 3 domain-containing protein